MARRDESLQTHRLLVRSGITANLDSAIGEVDR